MYTEPNKYTKHKYLFLNTLTCIPSWDNNIGATVLAPRLHAYSKNKSSFIINCKRL